MRIKTVYFSFSAVELLRFFLFARLILFFAGQGAQIQVLRMASSANIILFAALFFMGLNPGKYINFRQLVILGKAVSLFSGALAVVPLIKAWPYTSPDIIRSLIFLGIICLWDLFLGIFLFFVKTPEVK